MAPDELSADERVARYVLRAHRMQAHDRISIAHPELPHLAVCDQVTVTHPEMGDGVYGCDTGCEHGYLEAVLSCPHGEEEDFLYGEFGEIADIIKALNDEEPHPAEEHVTVVVDEADGGGHA